MITAWLVRAEEVRELKPHHVSILGDDAGLSGYHGDGGNLVSGFALAGCCVAPVLRGTLGNELLQGLADPSLTHPSAALGEERAEVGFLAAHCPSAP